MGNDHITPIRCTICMTGGCDGLCHKAWPVGTVLLPPKGCICPPGSEATCQRIDCGRGVRLVARAREAMHVRAIADKEPTP